VVLGQATLATPGRQSKEPQRLPLSDPRKCRESNLDGCLVMSYRVGHLKYFCVLSMSYSGKQCARRELVLVKIFDLDPLNTPQGMH
jgi:hypothetical protein